MPLMGCGHASNATSNGKPSCVICIGIDPGAETVVVNPPVLDGRYAYCYNKRLGGWHKPVPSPVAIVQEAFFEYRGPGSDFATFTCDTCKYRKIAHENNANNIVRTHAFTPVKDIAHDRYYCG